jgi:hypothetical protein
LFLRVLFFSSVTSVLMFSPDGPNFNVVVLKSGIRRFVL